MLKVIFNLLVVALTVMAGWYSHPGLLKWMEESKARGKNARAAEIAAAVQAATGNAPAQGSSSGGTLSARQLVEQMRKNSPSPNSLPQLPTGSAQTGNDGGTGTGMAGSPAPASTPVVAQDEFELKYPMPVFKEISEITKDWTMIPSRAFPRPVKTLVAINLEGPNGKVPLPEQSPALAVAMTQGMLVLMKNREDPARSLVPLANTDLKTTLTALYEKYKAYKIDLVMKQRERARKIKANANGATDTELTAAGPKPKVESGGIITAMVESLRFKQITETTEERITAWGDLNIEEFEGKSYWTGTIQCTVDNAIFGPTPTELMALIRDDKVVKWLYSGSKEEVQ
jgi:hypothetical protein